MKLLIPILFSLLLVPTSVFAQTSDVETPFNWKIKFFFDDIKEFTTMDDVEKLKFQMSRVEELQQEIINRSKMNIPIPDEFEDKRAEKLTGIENALSRIKLHMPDKAKEHSNAITVLEAKLTQIDKLDDSNKIRLVADDIEDLLPEACSNIETEKCKKITTDKLTDIVDVSDACVSKISSLTFSEDEKAISILERACPELNDNIFVSEPRLDAQVCDPRVMDNTGLCLNPNTKLFCDSAFVEKVSVCNSSDGKCEITDYIKKKLEECGLVIDGGDAFASKLSWIRK